MNKPAILLVDDDPQVLAAVRRDVRSRYRDNYTVLGAGSGNEALATVRELKARGDSLALVLSDQRMPGMLGVEVLAQAREIYPLARRVLLTAYSDMDAAVRAINEAHLDHYLSKPWDPPEEHLFPVLDDLLDEWQVARPREATGLRLVGHQWSPRSHAIKDFLASNLIPYQWLDAQRDEEARTLLDAGGVPVAELPGALPRKRNRAAQPETRRGGAGPGARRRRRRASCTISSSSARVPRASRRRYTRRRRGCERCCVDRHAPGGQAGTSSKIENYLGVPHRRERQRTHTPRRDAGRTASAPSSSRRWKS